MVTVWRPCIASRWSVRKTVTLGPVNMTWCTARLQQAMAPPERLFLTLCDGTPPVDRAGLAEMLQRELQLEVTLCQAGRGLTWDQNTLSADDLAAFLPALGAAFDGLGVSTVSFDFLPPRGAHREKPRSISSWRPWVTLTVLVIMVFLAAWLYLVQQRHRQLQELKDLIAQREPELARMRQACENWNVFRPFLPAQPGLPAEETGSRLSCVDILYELTRLFPDTRDAYITELLVQQTKTGNYEITITGNVRQGEFHTAFIDRLLGSELFRDPKQTGPLAQVAGNELYPFSFSVTCTLRRSGGGTP